MPEHILIVEDDAYILQGLTELLEKNGYLPTGADCIAQANAQLLQGHFSLLILDVTLPDGDGVSFCHSLRCQGDATPILFLTARDEEYDIVRGLDAGGNDYVTKPFRIQELLSRIRVLLRQQVSQTWHLGELEIDRQKMQVFRKGTLLSLTLTEYRLLLALLERRGVATREVLLATLWDCDGKYIDDNTLSVHMSRLREKIGAGHIRTIRGVGYQWVD